MSVRYQTISSRPLEGCVLPLSALNGQLGVANMGKETEGEENSLDFH